MKEIKNNNTDIIICEADNKPTMIVCDYLHKCTAVIDLTNILRPFYTALASMDTTKEKTNDSN